ncbi:MAG TPA: type II secretion system F family protein [Burkholderiales bacterium]
MRYQVTALVDSARVETIPVEARDAREARSLAQGRGYAVLAVRRRLALPFGLPERGFPLLLFSQELRVMVEAGLSLPEAMQALVEKESRGDLRQVLQRVTDALFEGASFSAALARQPHAFPPLYVETIKASEKTGDMSESLSRYITYHQQIDSIRRKVVSASVYPLLLLGAGALVALFLLGYVVPRFSAVYDDLGQQMPWVTQLMLGWGRFLHANAAAVAAAAVAAAAGIGYLLAQPAVRAAMLRRAWRIPQIGGRLRLYELARLYRTLGMLLKSGMPVVAAMRTASGLLGAELRPQLALALGDVEQGRALSQAMAERGLTTPIALRMLRVGERSGRMSELMERIAGYLEDDLARWVDWFSRLFEPILMLAIGAVIGAIVLLLYMPILELAGGLQ